MAHWWEMIRLPGGRCDGSLIGDVVAHWLEMRWLTGARLPNGPVYKSGVSPMKNGRVLCVII